MTSIVKIEFLHIVKMVMKDGLKQAKDACKLYKKL